MPQDDVDSARPVSSPAWFVTGGMVLALGLGAILYLNMAQQSRQVSREQLQVQLEAAQTMGDVPAQEVLISQLLEDGASDPELLELQARLAAEQQSPEKLTHALNQWADELGDEPPAANYLRAVSALRHREPAQALAFLEKMPTNQALTNPQRIEIFKLKSRAAIEAGELEAADRVLSEWVLAEQAPGPLAVRAELRARQGRWPEAVADAKQAGELAEGGERTRHFNRATVLERIQQQGAPDAAGLPLNPAQRKRYEDMLPQYIEAIKIFQAGYPREAEQALQALADQHPRSLVLRLPVAAAHFAATREKPTPAALLPISYRGGQTADRLARNFPGIYLAFLAEEQLEQDPGNPDVRTAYAQRLQDLGLAQLALDQADQILVQQPGNLAALQTEFFALADLGRGEEAVERFLRSASSQQEAAQRAMQIALAENRLQHVRDSLQMTRLLLARMPDSQPLRKTHATLQNKLNQWKQR